MFPSSVSNNSVIPNSYNFKTLEGNWYEERCIPEISNINSNKYSLLNPNSWQFKTTYDSDIGSFNKNYDTIKNKYYISNENYINYQDKRNDMYVSSYKNAYDSRYKKAFRDIPTKINYYDNKNEELKEYTNKWIKKPQSFKTTYNEDMYKTLLKNKK